MNSLHYFEVLEIYGVLKILEIPRIQGIQVIHRIDLNSDIAGNSKE